MAPRHRTQIPISNIGKLDRTSQIQVVNTTDHATYNVQIQDKESTLYTARFEQIARVEKGHPVFANVDIRKRDSGSCFRNFEAILMFEYETQQPNQDLSLRLPLTVRFSDRHGNVYDCKHEVVYDTFLGKAHIHLVRGTQRATQ